MDKRNGMETPDAGLWGKFVSLLMIVLLAAACSPGGKSDENIVKEIQDLRKEVKAMQEQLTQLQANQQSMLELLKKPVTMPEGAALPPQQFQPPAMPQALTVGQLLAGKDQYLGARVTVKGEVGPVLVHHKSLLLKSPQGMVEVLFGNLPDQMQVRRLASTPINQPLTVTGVVNLPPRATAGAAKLQITAEAIDF